MKYYCLHFNPETRRIDLNEVLQREAELTYRLCENLCTSADTVGRLSGNRLISKNKKLLKEEAKNIKQSWIDELKKQIKEIEEIPL